MRRSLKYDTIIGAEVVLEYVMLAIVEFTQDTLRIIDFCYLRSRVAAGAARKTPAFLHRKRGCGNRPCAAVLICAGSAGC